VTCHEAGRLLDAYVDDELGPSESASLRAHVASCVVCGRRVADREWLGRLVRSVPYYEAPDRVRTAIATARAQPRFGPRVLAWVAAVMVAVSLGGASAARVVRARHALDAASSIADDVVGSHVRALMADHLLDVRSTDQHTVKPWFLGKLDFSPPVADLGALGFPLVGGRLDYVAGRQAASLIYQRRQHTINLFIWPESSGTTPTDVRTVRGFHVRHWSREAMSFWAVSDLNDRELAEFAHALQQ